MIALPLYLICLAIELVYVFVRFLVAALAATALGYRADTTGLVALAVAVFPLVWSILTLLGIRGGWGLMWEYGARRPSSRDKGIVKPVLAELRRRGADRPWLWLVIDDPTPNAQAVGRTIYISSGLIGHPSLAPVLAHESGHFGVLGSDMLLALIRLEVPGLRALRVYLDLTGDRVMAGIVRTLSGGASWQLPMIRTLWQGHFRRNESHADRVTRRLGYGPELAAYLDAYERPVETAAAFRRSRTHPYAEHRIGRLDHTGRLGLGVGTRVASGRQEGDVLAPSVQPTRRSRAARRRAEDFARRRVAASVRWRGIASIQNSGNPPTEAGTPIWSSWDDYVATTTQDERRAWCANKATAANRSRLVSGVPEDLIAAEDVWRILEAAEGRCHWCGSLAVERRPSRPNGAPVPWEAVGRRIGSLDHIVPRWELGKNAPENLVWSCLWCNTWMHERIWRATDHGAVQQPFRI